MIKKTKDNVISFSEIRVKKERIAKEIEKFLQIEKEDKFKKIKNGLFHLERNKKQYVIKIYETSDYKCNNKSSLRIQASNSHFEFINDSIKSNQIPICLGYYYENDDIVFYNIPLAEMLKSKGTHSKSYPIKKDFFAYVVENKENHQNDFYCYKDKNEVDKYRYTTNIELILETNEKETKAYLNKDKKSGDKTILSQLFTSEILVQLCKVLMQETHNQNTIKENSKNIVFTGRDVENITNQLFKYIGCKVLDYAKKDLSFDSLVDNVAISTKTVLFSNTYVKVYEMPKIINEGVKLTTLSATNQAIKISSIFNNRRKTEEETYLIKDWEYVIYRRYEDKVDILNSKIQDIDIDMIKIRRQTKSSLSFSDGNADYIYSYSNNTLSLYHKNIPTLVTIELENKQYENNFFEDIVASFRNNELLKNKKAN